MIFKNFITLVSFLVTSLVFSQGETNNWFFGRYAGLDFNSGNPVAVSTGQILSDEGTASISTATGDLLFYTDGEEVYNSMHQLMPNGTDLFGSYSSTQSAIIVPKPGSSNLYYIFTSSSTSLPDYSGVRYSIVDMNLNGGLGDVIIKNILLVGPSSEKLTAIQKSSNEYLIVTRGYGDNSFYTFSLTSTGVNPTPVVSYSGMVIFLNYAELPNSFQGCLKLSPSGDKIVSVNSRDGVELFDFDINTGIVSNPIILSTESWFYGAEFSPSGRFLYLTNLGVLTNSSALLQYDLNSPNIAASVVSIRTNTTRSFGNIQLASDYKIYVAKYGIPKLDVIHNPEGLGLSCNHQIDAVELSVPGQPYPIECFYGLPQFVVSYFSGIISSNFCFGDTTSFSIHNNTGITSAIWDFGDGFSGSGVSTSHAYSAPGTYNVTVQITDASGTITKSKQIVISVIPTATQPNPILACDDNNDGFYNFDLTQNTTAILNGQSTTQFGVNYYANITDYNNKVQIANPGDYQNLSAYQSQTIIAEVYNKANGKCNAITNFNIQVFESPLPNVNVPAIQKCDNTSFGSDTDGRVVFDLTERQNTILNGQTTSVFTVEYYRDSALTNLITTPNNYVNTNANETIFVKVFNTQNPSCSATTSFQIEVFSLPMVTATVSLKQCDDNNDGFSSFNLNEALQLISTNTSYTFSFHETHTLATQNSQPITNLTAYPNQIVSNDQVFVRVQNANGCFRVVTLNLVVSTTQISNSIQEHFYVCDDVASGSITDGIATFNFSSANAQIASQYPSGQLLYITYYRNITDALAEQNAISDISNYTNIGYPNTQNIYVRVDSQLNNECIGLGHHITLHVERIPIIQPQTYTQCDDNQDGFFAFNTTNLQSDVLNGLTNVTLSYWDANNNPLPSPLPNPFNTATQTIRVRATNNTTSACFYESAITFKVDDLPEAFAIPTSLTAVCDGELNPVNQDGLYSFDTSSFQNTILGTQTGMIVNYFDGNGNSLSSPLPNPFLSATQNIRVEVINPLNTTCKAYLTIPLVVQPVPEIELHGDELICSNNPLFTKEISAGLLDETTVSNYTYQWFLNSNPISGETNYTLTVNTEGIYTVEVTNSNGCVRTRTLTVTASNIATIENVQVVDLSDENSVTVLVTGLGDYEYSLDNEYWQTSNVFSNIEAGIYTVYVKDLNGCGVATEEISVLGIPNYFTPNGDGYNDYWNIKGINSRLNAETIIYIFDRYGKLVKQISPLSQGWDGSYNGNQMPSSDYWYSVQLEDGRLVKGHFSLKR